MRKWLALIAVLLLSAPAVWAQNDSLRLGYVVRGNVLDAATGNPLESVHVSIPGRRQATVTNADGYFVLKSTHPIDQIECTFLGYKTRRVKGTENKIYLQRENLQLSAASIISGDPRAIVQAALGRIWDSYCTQPELLECFYRETVRKRSRYTYVAEAVARLYKGEYDGSVSRDGAALEKSRVLVSQRRTDTLSVKMQGGPAQAQTLDLVKNTGVLFGPEELGHYGFEMQLPDYIGDRLQFVIRMYPVLPADHPLYHCVLYIDRELLTFTRIEASLDMADKAMATRQMLVHKPLSLRFFPEEATLVMNYRLDGEKTRLEYFRSTIRFRCDWRKRLFKTHYAVVNELVVTDVRSQAIPIAKKDQFRSTDILNEKAAEFLDPDFWAGYNIIEPSESLEHAIKRLRKQQ